MSRSISHAGADQSGSLGLAGRLGRAGLAGLGLALVALLLPVSAPLSESGAGSRAAAACASNTGRSITGTVMGEDGRDVNVSIGYDLVDVNGRALNADPNSASYGCAKTGGYSVAQTYLNHFVGPEGVAPVERTRGWSPAHRASSKQAGPVIMRDGTPVRRDWKLANIPSNAVGAYIEVYHRGYQGSPCRDSAGNYCFNPPTLTKYGYANKHLVPVGTQNLPIRLPMTCAYGGRAGSISGNITNAAGQPVALQSLYAWTEAKWNAAPFIHGWGSARFSGTGSYTVPSLASGQNYTIWATTKDGRTIKRTGVPVGACKATTVNFRV